MSTTNCSTNYQESQIVQTMEGNAMAAWDPWAGLLTAVADAEAGTVTEIAYTGYGRVQVTMTEGATPGLSSNSAPVTFGKMTGGAGGTASHVGIWDDETAGNLRYIIQLDTAKLIAVDDTPEFDTDTLTIQHF